MLKEYQKLTLKNCQDKHQKEISNDIIATLHEEFTKFVKLVRNTFMHLVKTLATADRARFQCGEEGDACCSANACEIVGTQTLSAITFLLTKKS